MVFTNFCTREGRVLQVCTRGGTFFLCQMCTKEGMVFQRICVKDSIFDSIFGAMRQFDSFAQHFGLQFG